MPTTPTRSLAHVLLVAILGLLVVGGSCSDDGGRPGTAGRPERGTAPAGAEPGSFTSRTGSTMRATRIAGLGSTGTALVATRDGRELLVSERDGLVWRMRRTRERGWVVPRVERRPVLDLRAATTNDGERGLLGIALAADDGRLLTYSSTLDGSLELAVYDYAEGQPVDVSTKRVLLSRPHPYEGHYAGTLAALPDGDVLVAVGDMGVAPLAQDGGEIYGGVVRIGATAIRDGASPAPYSLVAKGLRNPWRISYDATSRRLFVPDVGEHDYEEVNRVELPPAGAGPLDFGWPRFEGTREFTTATPLLTDPVEPVLVRSHADGVCGVMGGAVYRGSAVAGLRGRYLHGDFCSTEVRSIGPDDDLGDGPGRIAARVPEPPSSFGVGSDGELYLLAATGGVYRLDPEDWNVGSVESNLTLPPLAATTTTTAVLPPDACGIDQILVSLSTLWSGDRKLIQPALVAALAQLRPKVTALPPELAPSGATILEAIGRLVDVGARTGWDPAIAEVTQITDDAFHGTGSFAAFPGAVAEVVAREQAACPS